MATQIIISQSGPLPITAQFQAPTDAPAALLIAGSVWTQQPNSMIGILAILDGTTKIAQSLFFANPAGTHLSVVPAVAPIQLTEGTHTLQLVAVNSATVSDQNDSYTVILMY